MKNKSVSTSVPAGLPPWLKAATSHEPADSPSALPSLTTLKTQQTPMTLGLNHKTAHHDPPYPYASPNTRIKLISTPQIKGLSQMGSSA